MPTGVSFQTTNGSIGSCGGPTDYYNVGGNPAQIQISASSSTAAGTYSLSISSTLYPNAATYTLTVGNGGGGGGGGGGGNTGSGSQAQVNIGTIASGAGIIVCYVGNHSGGPTPTDSQGNAYTFRSGGNYIAAGQYAYWYDSLNVTGGSNFTITVTDVGHTVYGIAAQSYTGIKSGDTFSTWTTGNTSSPTTSPTITPTHANLILVGMSLNTGNVINAGSTPNSGWVNTASDGTYEQLYGNTVNSYGTWKVEGGAYSVGIGSYWVPSTSWTMNAVGTFSNSTGPFNQSNVAAGTSATFTITTTSQDNVTLSYVSGLPTGCGQSFSVNPINSTNSSTFTVTTSATTPAGVYTINLSATDGNTTVNFSVVLQVLGV
jgi:hypothetical protein